MAKEQASGSCLCGGIRFEVSGEPVRNLLCYCLDCQKGSGGPCQVVLGFKKDDITVADPDNFMKMYLINVTKSGYPKEKHFCGNCGCTMWTIPTHLKGEILMVRVSLFDTRLETSKPGKQIFTDRMPEYMSSIEIPI